MATISAMAGQTSMMYRISMNGLGLGSSTGYGGLISSLPGAYNTSNSYMSSLFGSSSSFRSLLTDYYSTRGQFASEMSSAMSGLSAAVSTMKGLNFNVGQPLIKAAEEAGRAADKLQSQVNDSVSGAKSKQNATSAINTLNKYINGSSKADDAAKNNAKTAAKTVRSFLDRTNGVDEDTAKKADEAAGTLKKLTEDPASVAEKAKDARGSLDAIRNFLENHDDADGATLDDAREAIASLREVVTSAGAVNDATDALQDFVRGYSGSSDETRGALDTVLSFAREASPADRDSVSLAGESLDSLDRLIDSYVTRTTEEDDIAGGEAAFSAMRDFLDMYDGVAAHAATQSEARDAIGVIEGDIAAVRQTYEPLGQVENFVNGDVAARDDVDRNARDVVGAVEDFVTKYNSASRFLNGNREVSTRVAALAGNFSMTYFSHALSDIGITTKASGELSVDTERLTAALRDRPEAVSYALGSGGLTGRAERNLGLANMQQESLFPSVTSMMGGNFGDSARSMYSGRALTMQMRYMNVGNLLNMYF